MPSILKLGFRKLLGKGKKGTFFFFERWIILTLWEFDLLWALLTLHDVNNYFISVINVMLFMDSAYKLCPFPCVVCRTAWRQHCEMSCAYATKPATKCQSRIIVDAPASHRQKSNSESDLIWIQQQQICAGILVHNLIQQVPLQISRVTDDSVKKWLAACQ